MMLALLFVAVGCTKPKDPSLTKITLSGDDSGLVGETITLTATLEPADVEVTLTWESSNTEVATVSNEGVVSLLAKGETTITVSSGEIKDSKKITVEEPKPQPEPDKLTVKISGNNEVNIGETIKLTASITPVEQAYGKDVVWSSDDNQTATVNNNGVVTGVKAGKVTITATVDDASDSIEITVNEVPATAIEITSADDATEVQVERTLQLSIVFTPANASNRNVTWESSDDTKATVDATGLVTGVAAGDVTITAKLGTLSDTFDITVLPTEAEPKLSLVADEYNIGLWSSTYKEHILLYTGAFTGTKTTKWGDRVGIDWDEEKGQYVVAEILASGVDDSATIKGHDFVLLICEDNGTDYKDCDLKTNLAVGDFVTIPVSIKLADPSSTANVTVKFYSPAEAENLPEVIEKAVYIGETGYDTVADAIAAMKENDVVKFNGGEITSATINVNNVTLKGYGTKVTGKITLGENTTGVTIDSFEFTGLGQVECTQSVSKFTFKNNNVHDITIEAGTYAPTKASDSQAVVHFYCNGTVSELVVTGNTFKNVSCFGIVVANFAAEQTSKISNNSFLNMATGSIKQEGSNNNGTLEITGNTFKNDALETGYVGILFRIIGPGENEKENIKIENNTFTNIGKTIDPVDGYGTSGAIISASFREKAGSVLTISIKYNEFVGCDNGIYLRDNGGTPEMWVSNIQLNLFQDIAGYCFHGETVTGKGHRNALKGNAFLDKDGKTLTADQINAKVLEAKENVNNYSSKKELTAGIDEDKNPKRFVVGSERYATLAEALEKVEDKGTITVGSVRFDIAETITINKSVTIVGPNAETASSKADRAIEAEFKLAAGAKIIIAANDVTFKGIKFEGVGEAQLFQFKGEVENFTLTNNVFNTFNTILRSSEDDANNKIKGKLVYDNNVFETLTQFFAWVQATEDGGLTEVQLTNNVVTGATSLNAGLSGALKLLGAESTVKVTAKKNLFDGINPVNGIFNVASPKASLTVRFNTFKNMAVNNVISAANQATVNADDNLFLDAEGNIVTTVEGFPGKVSATQEEMDYAIYIDELCYAVVVDEFLADFKKFSGKSSLTKEGFFAGTWMADADVPVKGIWAFFQSAEYGEKWAFLLEYVQAQRAKAGLEALSETTAQASIRAEFHKFVNGTNTPPQEGFDGSDYSKPEVQQELMDKYHPLTKKTEAEEATPAE